MSLLETVNSAFEALFYGSASWLGVMLYLGIILGLMLKWKYTGVFLIPITIFIGFEYVNHDLGWHATIMFFLSLFTLIYLMKTVRKGR